MKYFRTLISGLAVISLTACGNLSKVTTDGSSDHLVWPKIEKDTFVSSPTQVGSWPNWTNVRIIERGMKKDQIRQLIGNPQFNEGFYGVREWDYVFNYRENGEHKICQYKILFDKQMNAQNFYWWPKSCAEKTKFTLSADLLFDFDKASLQANGVELIKAIAQKLEKMHAEDVEVAAYSDRLGSEKYNLALSQSRADFVKQALIAEGVKAKITAVGYGEKDQVKACDDVTGKMLKECLRPNRRVEISAKANAEYTKDFADVKANTQNSAKHD